MRNYDRRRVYPRGFKTFKILEYIQINPRTSKEIRLYSFELSYGKGTFDKKEDRGYWCMAFHNSPYKEYKGCLAEKLEYNFDSKRYNVSEKGLQYLDQYKGMFDHIRI